MPIYERDMDDGTMRQKAKWYICGEKTPDGVCGSTLSVCWGGFYGYDGYILRCTENIEHNKIVQPYEPGPYGIPGFNLFNLKGRTHEIMTRVGEEKAKALQPHQYTTSLSQQTAMEILRTIWPQAPDDEVLKAAMVCHQYGLNPLMKHLFLVKFKGRDHDTWATIMSIRATRVLASRSGYYSYVDNTPRVMTQEEQQTTFGESYEDMVVAITKLLDSFGNSAQGYGFWPKNQMPYGTDKGNTKFNMAAIRSERQALERKFPDALPQGIDVVDEQFVPQGDGEKPALKVVDPSIQEAMTSCWESQEGDPPIPQESGIDQEWLNDALKQIHWSEETAISWIVANLDVRKADTLEEMLSQLGDEKQDSFVAEIQRQQELLVR